MTLAKKIILLLTGAFLILFLSFFKKEKPVNIVVNMEFASEEVRAAEILKSYLSKIYPKTEFRISEKENEDGTNIFALTLKNFEKIVHPSSLDNIPSIPESFSVFTIQHNNKLQGVILGADDRGLFYGIYSLLERLGCGFYLSNEVVPSYSTFSFEQCSFKDEPLIKDRIVFNWHNFLSSCSSWNYEDWCSWIDQSAKMRYNSIMVHAYGNNPMFSFDYNGIIKKVGYLTTSSSGRDWGAQNINDVRRLPGGDIFTLPVFGSEAAKVPEGERVRAATQLMSKVFQHAKEMEMNIVFAIDVDTWSANPINLIESLPPESLIHLDRQDVVNPDTPEGYKYYKAQIESLLRFYPQITTIAVWIRNEGNTLWDFNPEKFPKSWINEWSLLTKQKPELINDKYAAKNFSISKIIAAFQEALKELNKSNVNIWLGSWSWNYMLSANILLPHDVALIPLDWSIDSESDVPNEILTKIGSERKIIPIFWAQNDDQGYIGKPYTPFTNFYNKLKERNYSGFGIIHWTSRPLDLFFKSLANQVWLKSRNEYISETISNFVLKYFGSFQQEIKDYLTDWIINGPMFGRETTDHFIDLPKPKQKSGNSKAVKIIEGAKRRSAILSKVNQKVLSDGCIKMLNYFSQIELFYISFFQNQEKFYQAFEMLTRRNIDSAKSILETVNPEQTIELYTKASSNLEMTTGEKALVISMGTRWLPDFIDLKQQARMQETYYKFGPTKHDPLAQQGGKGTFFIDQSKKFWKCLGEKELKTGSAGTFIGYDNTNLPEESGTFIEINRSLLIPLVTFGGYPFLQGKYYLNLQFFSPSNETIEPNLYLINKTTRILKESKIISEGLKLKTISTLIDIKTDEKYFLEVESQSNDLQLTNLSISPL